MTCSSEEVWCDVRGVRCARVWVMVSVLWAVEDVGGLRQGKWAGRA